MNKLNKNKLEQQLCEIVLKTMFASNNVELLEQKKDKSSKNLLPLIISIHCKLKKIAKIEYKLLKNKVIYLNDLTYRKKHILLQVDKFLDHYLSVLSNKLNNDTSYDHLFNS